MSFLDRHCGVNECSLSVNRRHSRNAGGTVASLPALSIVEILDRLKDRLRYRDDDELGDPGTSIKMYWLPRIGIDEQHINLPAVPGIDRSGALTIDSP